VALPQAVGRTGETRLRRLTALVGVGYFLVWTVFGMAAFPLGVALAAIEMQQPALARAVPIAVGVVVLIPGSIQFTAWKAISPCLLPGGTGRGRTLLAPLSAIPALPKTGRSKRPGEIALGAVYPRVTVTWPTRCPQLHLRWRVPSERGNDVAHNRATPQHGHFLLWLSLRSLPTSRALGTRSGSRLCATVTHGLPVSSRRTLGQFDDVPGSHSAVRRAAPSSRSNGMLRTPSAPSLPKGWSRITPVGRE
jgi:Predicted metal-binding integral membrane protein (DUF2182)